MILAFLTAGIFNTVLLKVFSVNVSIKITAMPCIIGARLNMAVCLISSALISAYSVKTAAVLGVLVFSLPLIVFFTFLFESAEHFGTVILRSVCVFAILALFFLAMSLYNKKRMTAEIGK